MEFPTELTRAKIDEFRQRGFCVTPDILKRSEIEQFGAAVDREVRSRTRHDRRPLQEKTVYEQSFIQCMRLWESSEQVRALSCHSGLAGLAAQLLQEPTILLWQDQALYKEPGGRETTAHQDQPFWPIGDAPLVSAWIPLDDVTVESGAMAYVPTSQELGRLRVVDITHSTEPFDILADPRVADIQLESVQVKAGSIIWHDGFTIHRAHANQTVHTRRVFTVVYLAAGYPRANSWPAFPLDRAGVAVGALMQGEGMPVLWPPPEDLPVAPSRRGQDLGPQHD
ncbi:MAG TPA: hypothetical protein EYQ22_05790 [Gammaproteobacteria bacterium]|nr:hypothetical protein [Gammaproteobacteria bacterium]HIK71047.1 hypothetical protein [Pseudomonadales bacterium]